MKYKGLSVHYITIIAIVGAALLALGGGTEAPRAQAQANFDLYTDSLPSGWESETSGTTAVFNNSTPVHDGSVSLAVTHTAPEGGVYLKPTSETNRLAWNAYEVIRFWIHGGTTGGQEITVKLVGLPPFNNPYESVGYDLPALTANAWTYYEINLAELGTTTYDIAKVKFHNKSKLHGQPTYYLDNIQFGFATQQAAPAPSGTLTIGINTAAERHAISPYIYGTNKDFRDVDRLPARRLSGNRTTGYNWENNASNGGSDTGSHNSDPFMCWSQGLPYPGCEHMPGAAITNFHNKSVAQDAYSLVTVQMAGYVAKDMSGPVGENEAAPSSRWVPVVPAKGAPFTTTPDLNDNAVYMDEFVNFLVQEYGPSTSALGVRGYTLDNEPALWPHTHKRIWPASRVPSQPTYAGLVSSSIEMAQAVKAVDPQAEIFGPAAYGFEEFRTLQGAPDQDPDYHWFLDYYLEKMHEAEPAPDQRLLDVLDVHWYPEARDIFTATQQGTRIVTGDVRKGSQAVQQARMQAPRSLWDPAYAEQSWIALSHPGYLPLLPELQASIDEYYPDTKLAFTEFDYGGEDHISGGIATADVLGIFGRHGVYMAHHWNEDARFDPTYTAAAYRLYRDYDGNHSAFEDTHVQATTSDNAKSSVYASANADNSELHVILLNKTFSETLTGTFNIAGNQQYAGGSVWGFNQYTSRIFQAAPISGISGNSFQYNIPPLTAYHIVLWTDPPAPTKTPTLTRTPTITRTPTLTRTPTATRVPEPNTCDVNYTKVGEWTGGFQGGITIANTGTSAINGWTLQWSFADGQTITSSWNGIFTQSGAAVTVQNEHWTGTINAGGSVGIGFLADWSGANTAPTSFTLNGIACTVSY